MGYTAPPTVATGDFITAAIWNTHLKDNIIELDARTTVSSAEALGVGTTTSNPYVTATTVAGPVVVANLLASTRVMVTNSAKLENNTAFGVSFIGVGITGAATIPASDGMCIYYQAPSAGQSIQVGSVYTFGTGVAGSTTFSEKVRVNSGTGTFASRRLSVTSLG